MKRLLLPLLAALALPTAVIAFPWDKKNQDIIIKTDLNEEFIVKDSTITITPWTIKQTINALQRSHPIDTCILSGRGRDNCSFDYLFSEEGTLHLEKEKILISSGISTPINIIKFRPIFVDLNGSKSANTYYSVACVNFEEIGMLDEYTKDLFYEALVPSLSQMKEDLPDLNSGLAIESLKKAVCEKYKTFDKYEFSIDQLDLKERKYYSGFAFQVVNGKVKIVFVWKGSDAEKYLKKDDEILEVNNINVSSVEPKNIGNIISAGDNQTPMKIKIKRKKEILEFLILREQRY